MNSPSRLERFCRLLFMLIVFLCSSTQVLSDTIGLVASYEQAVKTQQARGQDSKPRELIYQVSEAYFNATISLARLESLESKLVTQQWLLDLTESKIEAGLLRRADLYDARMATASTEADIAHTRFELEQRLAELELLTGPLKLTITPLYRKPNAIEPPPENELSDYMQLALKNNADYQIAKAGLPETQYELDLIQQRTARELHLVLLGIRTAISMAHSYEKALLDAAQHLDIVRVGYQSGFNSTKGVFNAVQDFADFKHQHNQAKVQLVMHALRLKMLLGTLDKTDLVSIEQSMSKVPLGPVNR